jgi:hypothetical protein
MSAHPQGACCANAQGTKKKIAKALVSTVFIFMLLKLPS